MKELSQVGVTSHHAKEVQVGEHAANISSFINNRSGSGFFSTFSNVLPAFFSLSGSPDKTPTSSPDKDTLSSSPTLPDSSPSSSDNTVNCLNGQHDAKDSQITCNTPPTAEQQGQGLGQEPVSASKPLTSAPFNVVKLGDERSPLNLSNGQGNHTTDPSGGLEDGFVEVSASANSTSDNPSQSGGINGRHGSSTDGRHATTEGSGANIGEGGHLTTEGANHNPSSEIDVQLFLKLNSYPHFTCLNLPAHNPISFLKAH